MSNMAVYEAALAIVSKPAKEVSEADRTAVDRFLEEISRGSDSRFQHFRVRVGVCSSQITMFEVMLGRDAKFRGMPLPDVYRWRPDLKNQSDAMRSEAKRAAQVVDHMPQIHAALIAFAHGVSIPDDLSQMVQDYVRY
jgi:hypothetical protein